jgi:hypothetical protein
MLARPADRTGSAERDRSRPTFLNGRASVGPPKGDHRVGEAKVEAKVATRGPEPGDRDEVLAGREVRASGSNLTAQSACLPACPKEPRKGEPGTNE